MTTGRPEPSGADVQLSLAAERRAGSRDWAVGMVLGVACAGIVQALAVWVGDWPLFDGIFMGPDAYMRLNRVLECQGGPGCPGGLFPRTNAPFGEVLHWPFLQDWMLLAIAAPFRLALPRGEAVVISGYLLGPILQVGAIAITLWAARSLVSGRAWSLAGVFLGTQIWAVLAFAPSRPDHHGLQAVFFLLAVAGAIRLMADGPDRLSEVVTAVGMGVGLWVSVEGLATVTVPLFVLGLRWIVSGRPSWAWTNARVALWCAVVLGLSLLLDGPQAGRLAAVYDRVSIVHFACIAGVALFWWITVLLPAGWSLVGRLTWCVGGAVLLAVGLSLPFPGLIRGPLVDVDPRIVPIWLDRVAEYVPLVKSRSGLVIAGLGPLVIALPAVGWAMATTPDGRRWAWALVFVALVWFGILTVLHGSRWVYYLHVLVPLPMAWIVGQVFKWVGGLGRPWFRATFQVVTVPVLALLFPFVGALAAPPGEAPASEASLQAECAAEPLVTELGRIPPSRSGEVVLATVWWGPEIVFRTGYDALATPYHRNAEGILASLEVMSATEEEEIYRRLAERDVRYIARCRGGEWTPALGDPAPESLMGRLEAGRPPPFVVPVELPPALEPRYSLWRVEERGRRVQR